MKGAIAMAAFFALLALISATGHGRWQAIQEQEDYVAVDTP